MIILISPYSQKLPKDIPNPKNFPYWKEFVEKVKQKIPDIEIVQIGVQGEEIIPGTTKTAFNLSQSELLELAKTSSAWLSVDNFFQHFCSYYNIPNGIVLFGQSDPYHFGYSTNINLLKDRKYLRKEQFLYWWHETVKYNPEAFVDADTVAKTLFKVLKVD